MRSPAPHATAQQPAWAGEAAAAMEAVHASGASLDNSARFVLRLHVPGQCEECIYACISLVLSLQRIVTSSALE